jgi:hypothetical protein
MFIERVVLMKSFKITNVTLNQRKKQIEIQIKDQSWSLPFSKLMTPPSPQDPIVDIWIDSEMGSKGVTYVLLSGNTDSVPLDAFLDFNRDPELIREMELHRLTLVACAAVEKSGLSKRDLSRRMGTSMSQLLRVLDPANSKKTFDQLLKLFTVLGHDVRVEVSDVA